MRIQLYTLIPAATEDRPIVRTGRARWRNRLARTRDLALWAAGRTWRGHYSTHEDMLDSNRGDVAVRMGVKQQLMRVFGRRSATIDEVPWGALDPSRPADLLVLCGGGFFFPDGHGMLPERFLTELAAIEQFQCPVIGASLGLNADLTRIPSPWIHQSQRPLVRRFVQALSLFSVRDRITQAAFRPYTHAPDLIADPALFLYDELGTVRPFRPAWRPATGRPLSIGINLAFHGHEVSQLQTRTLPRVISALKSLANRLPCRFSYFVHSSAEHALARALQLAGIPCTVVSGSVAQLQSAYATLDLHVAQMLHSAILAFAQGTPVLGLAYDIKSFGFFDLISQSELCLDMWKTRAEDILDVMLHMIATQGDLRAAVQKRTVQLRKESDDFYDGAAMLVETARTGTRTHAF